MVQLFCQFSVAVGVKVFVLCAKANGCVSVNARPPVATVVAVPLLGTPVDGIESP
jgi:hypothetical protein